MCSRSTKKCRNQGPVIRIEEAAQVVSELPSESITGTLSTGPMIESITEPPPIGVQTSSEDLVQSVMPDTSVLAHPSTQIIDEV